jgi:8-amino-7-oxononanoate synthase
VREVLGIAMDGLIVPIEIGDNVRVMELQKSLKEELGILVGAIRQPTVDRAIIRLIARLDITEETLIRVCERFSHNTVKSQNE